jgi:TM2 domain-containing membrane protein YozV
MKLLSSTVMATSATAKPLAPAAAKPAVSPLLCLLAGWLVPGAGHFLLKKPIRGALLFLSVVGMFAIGIGLQGKIHVPSGSDLLETLGFVAQLGNGILYFLARAFDWGHASVQTAVEDYGTKFLIVGGLLNIISAIDAHSLASGRKAS